MSKSRVDSRVVGRRREGEREWVVGDRRFGVVRESERSRCLVVARREGRGRVRG